MIFDAYNKIIKMIGSLGEFISLQTNSILAHQSSSDRQNQHLSQLNPIKRRGKSTFQQYVPQDKAEMLLRYEKNNIFHINRKKYNSIEKQAHSKQQLRRPLYQHRSFFVKPEIERDYIAKEELKRKHNLLRAILRMKQNEEEPKGESDYEQSFQRLYSGFKAIHPDPILDKPKPIAQEQDSPVHKIGTLGHNRNKSGLNHRKRLEYEHCLMWAKKHNKNGDFFAQQLGKFESNSKNENTIQNRQLIEQISKKVELNWLE